MSLKSTVTNGSGNDVLEMTDSATEADLSISSGAGDDQLTLETDTTEGQSLTIDMGAGTDTLVLVASSQILPTGTDTVSVSGVENLTYTSHATDHDIISSFFNGKTYSLKDTSAIAGTFTIDILAADTAIDLSGMTVTAANAAAVAGDTFVINTSAAAPNSSAYLPPLSFTTLKTLKRIDDPSLKPSPCCNVICFVHSLSLAFKVKLACKRCGSL